MFIQNTLSPYDILKHEGIEYQNCRDFNHISRYKGLRQVAHLPISYDRYTTLGVPNPFDSNVDITFYDVPATEENRLDLISYKFFNSASYSWIIAYFNGIEDGFTVLSGQRLKIPKSFTSLFNTGEILAPIPALNLNLGIE